MPTENLRVGTIIAVAALALALAAGIWFGSRTGAATEGDSSVGVSYATIPATIVVHVSGAVNRPGLVTVAASARVADAVASAGGAAVGADLGNLNLAAEVRDGDQITVPLVGVVAPTAGAVDDRGVDLNRATPAELEALPGVGPVLAERIVAYRELHGPFAIVEDLLDVGGIGEAKLAAMRNAIAAP